LGAPALAAELLRKVRAFADGAPQSDDIAILALKAARRKTSPAETGVRS